KRLRKLYAYLQNLIWVALVPAAKVEGRVEMALTDHVAILDAIEARNVEAALKQLRDHIESVKAILLQVYDKN
ncbi:FCD domain-containing protein, partial [candidate division KSB3 bacterium]|nr:FCD domain-containing protein [candidate division KSB3 bacterium]MBD3324595.1 FCD domain-containing protein [candidate division KSB3 bacterium]